MLESVKISRRQSEIRQQLAGLVGKDKPTEDETRSMETLDTEYRQNETRYRAALIAEDTERREAKGELETRSEKEYGELVDKFELRQVALHLDEGKALDGATAEVVQELRAQGGYRGVPVPFAALELRAGETVASGVPAPKFTAPVIDRIFPESVAVAMGAQIINVPQGSLEYPVTTSSISAAWAATETASVGNPQVYAVTNKPMTPAHTLGVQVVLTRKSMLQAGDALEAAVRRDLGGAISQEMDKAVMRGTNSAGEPDGVLNGNYGITETNVSAAASWAVFRAALVRFMTANAIRSASNVKVLIHPTVFDNMDDTLITDTSVSEWDRFIKNVGIDNIVMSANATEYLVSGGASTALLTTKTGGISPIFVGLWGSVDVIRDQFTQANSGALTLTALSTMDLTVARPAQLEILNGLS